jgi:tripartite-type tricarboxylate transporter receptor subunit TctC
MKELGYPTIGFSAGGLIAPAKTPDAVASVLEKACAIAAAAPDYKAIVERLGAEPRYLPGNEFRKMFEDDSRASAEAIRGAGLGTR